MVLDPFLDLNLFSKVILKYWNSVESRSISYIPTANKNPEVD
jgi:hypothetical protein